MKSAMNVRRATFPERGNIDGFTNVTAAIKADINERVNFLWQLRSSPFVQHHAEWDARVPFGGVEDITHLLDHIGEK